MREQQIENIYLAHGLNDFSLKNLDDLLNIHGIKITNVYGYSELSEEDKKDFRTFIINIFNSRYLESRNNLFPLKVYRAVSVDYLIKEDDTYTVLSNEVWNVNDANNKIKMNSWTYIKDNKSSEIIKDISKEYLRFEYENTYEAESKQEWLHVINKGAEWY